ncbi:MAG: hypothetical protein JXB85_11880 [Anaerolineales bacterium]|nr:hypothetical protein [Anaerolineales bacterium]
MSHSKNMRKFGWLAFTFMWIPFTTLMIAMLGLPEGEYAWSELPILARASLVVGGIFAIAATVLLVGAPIVSGLHNHAVLSRGLPAEATILSIADTGTTINNHPVVRLLLEVRPTDQPAFQAEAERLISRLQLHLVQPGAIVQVKYDPGRRSVALVEEDDSGLPVGNR